MIYISTDTAISYIALSCIVKLSMAEEHKTIHGAYVTRPSEYLECLDQQKIIVLDFHASNLR
jgi:hypothetical protein